MKKTFLLAAAAGVLFAAPAMAQSAHLTATFGEVRLSAGFTPDPYRVNMTAGGHINGAQLPGSCIGNIADAPDFEVNYEAGSLPLVFRTLSSADTTLIINGPDGRWYCDDDSYGDGDAMVRFSNPKSGIYDIWVGVLGSNTASATLEITETP
ncbi:MULTISPECIES: peptidase S1 [unclassified Brevundimonas]|uniref:peptidase S1 n=1 Tax=unclassified Brevundimonas TaxID=2622653 RepID=UPI0025BA7C47|nr:MULTISPECIES: peptidase S1 [unclassified Brevundimonas]